MQLPEEWTAELGLEQVAVRQKTPAGILIRPHRGITWDDVYRQKLESGRRHRASGLDQLSGDAYLVPVSPRDPGL